MKSDMGKFINLAGKIKTPLTLSGLVVVILYAVYRQVLSLNIFENIGANSTFVLLQNILDKIFWLALISILLGVASYLVTFILSRQAPRSSSSVSLIDASLDPHDSPYEQHIENGKKKIRPHRKSDKKEDKN
ncbi:MAG: hypothetical protein A3K45_03600 [Chloroflexi bacterium RIFOXYC12_FULL_59_14]|nr:MAG: hypothetical protein A3K45_03600 [Chloroflexi bacterium RIFOXYC12_FULL_59_14]